MRKVSLTKTPAFQFHLLQKFSDQIEHAVFSRLGGVSDKPFDSLNIKFGIGDSQKTVKKNREVICKALKLEKENLISANQTHGKNIEIIDEEFIRFHPSNKEVDNTDAFITNLCEVALMIQVADCQGILMYDPVKKIVAGVHAGWKGLAKDISGATIKRLKQEFGVDPKKLLVGISPSLGPCCALFTDPRKELPKEFHKFIDEENKVDLWSFSVEQLQKHGVQKKNIELAKLCTQCRGNKRFFSFRQGRGITGRFGVIIYLRR